MSMPPAAVAIGAAGGAARRLPLACSRRLLAVAIVAVGGAGRVGCGGGIVDRIARLPTGRDHRLELAQRVGRWVPARLIKRANRRLIQPRYSGVSIWTPSLRRRIGSYADDCLIDIEGRDHARSLFVSRHELQGQNSCLYTFVFWHGNVDNVCHAFQRDR